MGTFISWYGVFLYSRQSARRYTRRGAPLVYSIRKLERENSSNPNSPLPDGFHNIWMCWLSWCGTATSGFPITYIYIYIHIDIITRRARSVVACCLAPGVAFFVEASCIRQRLCGQEQQGFLNTDEFVSLTRRCYYSLQNPRIDTLIGWHAHL